MGTWFLEGRPLQDVLATLRTADLYGKDVQAIHSLACVYRANGIALDIWTCAEKLAKGSESEHERLVPLISEAIRFATDDRGILQQHIGNIQEFASHRRFRDFAACLVRDGEAGLKANERYARIEGFLNSEKSGERGGDWKALFHTYDETVNAPPAKFAIEGFLQEDAITLLGALAGHGKTLCMLAMVRALLEGGKLFHHFQVNEPAKKVIYLIPECGLSPFATRLKIFHLQQYVGDRLFYRTLSTKGSLALTDPLLLEAANGADVFLDTVTRFMGDSDENNSGEQRHFADTLFALQKAGARTVTGAHHAPKSFGKDSFMTLENVLRGSGDIGAMAATVWGLCQIDSESNRVFIQNVKPRDFQPCDPFIIQGRPSLDREGYFDLVAPPGFGGSLGDHKSQGGRPPMPDKESKRSRARELKKRGLSVRDIAEELGVGSSSVQRLVSE